jgi:hypothetical protein
MPHFVEPLVKELVTGYVAGTWADRQALLPLLSPGVCVALGWYARMLAGRSVRERSPQDLRDALVGLAIASYKEDYRDLLGVLALLYNSAVRLGEDATSLFTSIMSVCDSSAASFLATFLKRTEDRKAISVFGFSEGVGPHGFDYVPLMPEHGGPTALGKIAGTEH